MSKTTKSAKPVLWGNPTTDTEQVHEADAFAWFNRTPGWVPGYDEVVRANEIARNPMLSRAQKEHYYKQFGSSPRKLPIKVTWVRVAGLNGGHSYNASVDLTEWRRRGYAPATKEILEAAGMEVPATAFIDVDGSIRREDTALWFVDEARAQAYAREQAALNADFHSIRGADTGIAGSEITVAEHDSHRQLSLQELKDL